MYHMHLYYFITMYYIFKLFACLFVVIIVCGGVSPADALPFLQAAYNANMVDPEYAFITPYYSKNTLSPWEPWLTQNVSDTEKYKLLAVYKQSVVVSGICNIYMLYLMYHNRP